MSCLRIAILSSSSSSQKRVHVYAAINVPKLPQVHISFPRKPTSPSSTKLVQVFNNGSEKDVIITTSQTFKVSLCYPNKKCRDIIKLYAILKAVADRIEMHNYIWNSSLLFNSVKMMVVGLNTAIDNTALKLSSTLLFTAATGMLLIKNKIQTFEPDVVWWPKTKMNDLQTQVFIRSQRKTNNGWTPELEMEMRQILEVAKCKDMEDYERLGNLALNVNKTLAILGPLLTVIAALGAALERHGSSWVGTVAVMVGSLADFINSLEHGGLVRMVFEMYRNYGGFFKLLQENIEETLEEKDFEKRENGELFEKVVAKKLGRSVSQLRRLASKSAACGSEGIGMDELASKLF